MPKNQMRRKFLKIVYAATVFLPSVEAWSQVNLPKNPFNLGVASGCPTHNSVVLWTRLFDDGIFSSNIPHRDIPVKWELALDDQFKNIAKSGFINAVAALAHRCPRWASTFPLNRLSSASSACCISSRSVMVFLLEHRLVPLIAPLHDAPHHTIAV